MAWMSDGGGIWGRSRQAYEQRRAVGALERGGLDRESNGTRVRGYVLSPVDRWKSGDGRNPCADCFQMRSQCRRENSGGEK